MFNSNIKFCRLSIEIYSINLTILNTDKVIIVCRFYVIFKPYLKKKTVIETSQSIKRILLAIPAEKFTGHGQCHDYSEGEQGDALSRGSNIIFWSNF